MSVSEQAKLIFEVEHGWHDTRKRKATPKVEVSLGGKMVGGPLPASEAIPKMYAVWEDMHDLANEINRLDDLIQRQDAWLDANMGHPAYLDNTRVCLSNSKHRDMLVCRFDALDKRADAIVAQMDGPEVGELAKVHEWAPLGGAGLLARFQELVQYVPSGEDDGVPF